MAKKNDSVSSSRRKSRKAHFASTSSEKRVRMSAPLAKELREKHHCRSMPIRKDDEVRITRGKFKGREGKVTACYRRRWCIHVDKIVCDKSNAQSVPIPLDPSNVVITKLQLDKDRKNLMARKEAGKMPQKV